MRCATQVVAPILALRAGKALREAASRKAAEGAFEVRAARPGALGRDRPPTRLRQIVGGLAAHPEAFRLRVTGMRPCPRSFAARVVGKPSHVGRNPPHRATGPTEILNHVVLARCPCGEVDPLYRRPFGELHQRSQRPPLVEGPDPRLAACEPEPAVREGRRRVGPRAEPVLVRWESARGQARLRVH